MNAANRETRDVKVSVAMITYNHERFISQAIESVLMQQTDFAIELVIGEDCSTDSTRAIVQDYGARYPDRIHLLLPERNLGIMPNFVATLNACNGQYVALLEGDDYWTDPHKLQKQVDFLEAHPECSLCFHNTTTVHEDGKKAPQVRYPPGQKTFWAMEDIVYRNPITTCSVVFRYDLLGELPPWYHAMVMGDWPLWVLLAQHGPAGYLNDAMAAYRVHAGGVFSGRLAKRWVPGVLEAYDTIGRALDSAYHARIMQGKAAYLNAMAEEYLADAAGSATPEEAVRAYQGLWQEHIDTTSPPKDRLLARLYAHRFFRAAQSKDYATMRQSIVCLARYDRTWFRNRGFLSLSFEAILGRKWPVSRGLQ